MLVDNCFDRCLATAYAERNIKDVMLRQLQLTADEENELVKGLVALGYRIDYLADAYATIMNILQCSQDDAFRVLRDLQDRSVIRSEPESFEGQ